MDIKFATGKPQDIVATIKNRLSGRRLGQIVDITLDNGDLKVTIKKMGTSCLSFSQVNNSDGVHWRLSDEKIAFSHRAFKSEVLEKIVNIVEQAGGTIEA